MITPMVAVALVVVLAAVALVLDYLWLDAASVELTGAAESAALGAAAELAGDESLRDNADLESTQTRARRIAAELAAQNRVAGQPVELDSSPEGDVRFGRLVLQRDTGRTLFLETGYAPRTVEVTARRSRSRNNPVALFFQSLTGQFAGDVVVRAEATVDNRVVALRAFTGVPVPALPMAILKSDPAGRRTDTWDVQIGQGAGPDDFTYNPRTHRVERRPDGIPEIILRTAVSRFESVDGNVCFVDMSRGPIADRKARLAGSHQAAWVSLIGTRSSARMGQEQSTVLRQIARGWTVDDLTACGGELCLALEPVLFSGFDFADSNIQRALMQLGGACRVCLLYAGDAASVETGRSQVRCVEFVAGRVLAVRKGQNATREIVFQPGVLTTRTAVVAAPGELPAGGRIEANRYIYKLQLTR